MKTKDNQKEIQDNQKIIQDNQNEIKAETPKNKSRRRQKQTATVNLLITGVRYTCSDAELTALLSRLNEEHPRVVLVSQPTHDFGLVINVLEGNVRRGVVSRCDLDTALSIMHQNAVDSLVGEVTSVNFSSGYFSVGVETEVTVSPTVPDADAAKLDAAWEQWEWTDAQLMEELPGDVETQQSIKVLRMAMKQKGILTDEEIALHALPLIEHPTCDVSRETQGALVEIMRWLVCSKNPLLRQTYNRLMEGFMVLGSRFGATYFDDDYWTQLVSSDAADRMLERWYAMHPALRKSEEEKYKVMYEQYNAITRQLQLLPADLYFDHTLFGHFMQRLLYMRIPRKRLVMLLSAIVLRHHLSEELQLNREFDEANEAQRKVDEEVLAALDPIFYGNEVEAYDFLKRIKKMRQTDIPRLVNQLIACRKISDASAIRPLWKALHEHGLYDRTESNWRKSIVR